ncbi:hypothetical protein D5F01_LYC05142 [Larimichthys crocea]|uniref:G-protein coupled receptors family 1 profile domain-containing protein n=1 Tax=Larimichthys crocea TaxID=215358 RepID=A0A6G0IXZ8_LARCR|nr:hypothetical protein D5F01_LYC05142 [Larimichthys crocea]
MTDSGQWEHLIDVLSWVYIGSLIPSVIGSISVLVVSIVRWRHLKEQVHVLVQLALADLLAALILMATSAMNKVHTSTSVRNAICPYSLPLSLTFYCISFLLVVVYAWQSRNAVKGWRARPAEDEGGQSLVTLPVYAIVWLIPISIYLAYVHKLSQFPTSDRSSIKNCSCILFLQQFSNDSCSGKIHDIFIQVFLVSVVIPVILTCSVIYHKVGKWYKRQQEQEGLFPVEGDGRSRRRLKRMISTARNMVMVIFFCWIPAVVLIPILLSTHDVKQNILFVLLVIQAVTMSLQGFLNSMVYAWSRPNFTEAVLGEKTPLVTYDHQAFFDESLRTSAC